MEYDNTKYVVWNSRDYVYGIWLYKVRNIKRYFIVKNREENNRPRLSNVQKY